MRSFVQSLVVAVATICIVSLAVNPAVPYYTFKVVMTTLLVILAAFMTLDGASKE